MHGKKSGKITHIWCAFIMLFTCWLCADILFGAFPDTHYDSSSSAKFDFHSAQNLAIDAIEKFGRMQTAIGTFLVGVVTTIATYFWPSEWDIGE